MDASRDRGADRTKDGIGTDMRGVGAETETQSSSEEEL